MTFVRLSVVLVVVFGVISFCFGDPVSLIPPKISDKDLGDLKMNVSDADNLEFAIGTLKLRDPMHRQTNLFEMAKSFESPERQFMRELEGLRSGNAILNDFRPQEIDFVFEFEKVYHANPYLESLELELYSIDLKAAEYENTRRMAGLEAPHSKPNSAEKESPFKKVSFPKTPQNESQDR